MGYAVFAMALGICAGAVLRRTLPAMAVTLAGFIAVRVVIVLWVRAHYMSAVTVTYNVLQGYTPRGSFWQLAQGVHAPTGTWWSWATTSPCSPAYLSTSSLPPARH